MQNKVGDKESPCFTPLVVSNQSVYRKFSPQNRGLSRKKVVFRPPAWIKWERLMYYLLIFFHESSQIEEMPKKHMRLFFVEVAILIFVNFDVTVVKTCFVCISTLTLQRNMLANREIIRFVTFIAL